MSASVSFNGNKIVKDLDIFAKKQLPFAASLAVNYLAPIARKDVQVEMRDEFTYVSKFTIDSPLYGNASTGKPKIATKAEPWIDVYINWTIGSPGQSPADYLRRQVVGGPVLRTKFQKGMASGFRYKTDNYYLPIHDSPGAKLNDLGRIRASQYQEAGYAIGLFDARNNNKGIKKKKKEYFYIGPSLKDRKDRKKSDWFKGYGIYRAIGTDKHLLFKMLDKTPKVQPKFKFREAVKYSVKRNFQKQFDLALAQALAMR